MNGLLKLYSATCDQIEKMRLLELVIFEKNALKNGFRVIAGVDEAGRGPLAGPVVACACIIPEGLFFPGINDSKQLSAKKREDLFLELTSNAKVLYGIGEISHFEIDSINIYQATIAAMHRAIANLKSKPDYLLVDGMMLSYKGIPAEKIIKGDAKSQSIAAASIIAKETRDKKMQEFHEMWPQYGFDSHKGYGTKKHRDAIEKYGPCPIHRLSFEPLKSLALLS
ncbi:MAG TPA: ribonuclease HII [Parachlamydiaceae bacterium]|nr:ribonuclease HII [Parachlamydiaceae bacterium]